MANHFATRGFAESISKKQCLAIVLIYIAFTILGYQAHDTLLISILSLTFFIILVAFTFLIRKFVLAPYIIVVSGVSISICLDYFGFSFVSWLASFVLGQLLLVIFILAVVAKY